MEVKVDKLAEHPENPKQHKEEQINEIIRSVEMFGQFRPVIVDEDYTILAGHGLTRAMKKMGETTIDVKVMKGLDEDGKRKLLLVDNQISGLGSIDYTMMENLFHEMSDLDIPGFDQIVLEDLMYNTESGIQDYGKVEDPSDSTEPEFLYQGSPAKDPDAIVCPGCGMILEKKNL